MTARRAVWVLGASLLAGIPAAGLQQREPAPLVVTAKFERLGFVDAVQRLSAAAGVRVMLSGDPPGGEYSLDVRSVGLAEAAHRLLVQAPPSQRWEAEVEGGGLLHVFRVRARVSSKGEGMDLRLTFEFRNAGLREAVNRLAQRGGFAARVAMDVPDVRVTVRGEDLAPDRALAAVIRVAAMRRPGIEHHPAPEGYRIFLRN